MRKYYHFETAFRTLKDELKIFLQENNIYYKLCGCPGCWNFEILCNNDEFVKVDLWITNNTIIEFRAV